MYGRTHEAASLISGLCPNEGSGDWDGYNYVSNQPTLQIDPSGLLIEICCSPAMIGPKFPKLPGAGTVNPDDYWVRLYLFANRIDPDHLRAINLLPNHCFLKFSCGGSHEFTTEANSDLYYTPFHDLFSPIRSTQV